MKLLYLMVGVLLQKSVLSSLSSDSVEIFCQTARTICDLDEIVEDHHNHPADGKLAVRDDSDAMNYLLRYRYLSADSADMRFSSDYSEDAMVDSIRAFQDYAAVPMTGVVDTKTKEMMNWPRCGVPDYPGERKRRYTLEGSQWRRRRLTYRVAEYPATLTVEQVDDVLARAFELWTDVTPLSIEQIWGQELADMEISFRSNSHGDGQPFDGKGMNLGHAFFPGNNQLGLNGDIHFDADENWVVGSQNGTNLFQTAVHEIGHSLGLSHSRVTGAIMWPFSRPDVEEIQLHDDDITGIQALYGSPEFPKVTDEPLTEGPVFWESTSTTPSVQPPFPPLPTDGDIPEECIPFIDSSSLGFSPFQGQF